MGTQEDVAELVGKIASSQLQRVKLGPGIVGRNSSIAWALEVVMLAGVVSGAFLHSSVLVGISLVGAIVVALGIAYMNVKFGEENPAAALLEGSHFLQFHQMQATATKGESHSVELPSAQPTSSPLPLPGMRTNPGLPGEVESDT